MARDTARTTSTRTIGVALVLLALASIGAGQGPPPISAPPVARGDLPPALPGQPRPPLINPTQPAPPGGAASAAEPAPAALVDGLGTPLFPGQVVQPIDLASTLRMAGGRDLDIATAQQRVLRSLADLQEARGLWLPSFFTGPTFYSLNGPVQAINGQILTAHRNSLSLGTTASLANSFAAPPPGSGYPPLNSLSGVLRISDAIYQARSARRFVAANEAGVGVAINDALLAASEAYFDLQQAAGTLAIAREAADNADILANLTGSYARSGSGLEADHRRSLAEVRSRQRSIRAAAGQLKVASAELVRRLVLDPHVVVAPVEPAEAVIRLVADDVPLDDLICQAWRGRPELARARELVEAAVLQLKQAKLRPFVPSLAVSYSGAAFGGGANGTLGNLGPRSDFAASLFWDLRGLGLIDVAAVRRRSADKNTADIDLIRVRAQVANDVVASFETRAAAAAQMEEARESVAEAQQSLDLNLSNIRQGAGLPGATRPIEVLQPIQALAQARSDYLVAVLAYNRAQFRLLHALGRPPITSSPPGQSSAGGR
jgi:outer membrane protein TolC